MGWTSYPMHKPVKKWFIEYLGDNLELKALDIAIVKRNTLYAAIKDKTSGEVFCVVYLLRWSPKSLYNFSYKDMTEFCGPCECECPERILRLLTPLTDKDDPNGYARNWRKSVQEYHETRKALKGNFVFKLKEPIHFTNGLHFQYFKKIGRTIIAGKLKNNKFDGRMEVRINRLYNFDIEKITVES